MKKTYDKDAISLAERLLGKKQGELAHLRKFDTREKMEAELERLASERESERAKTDYGKRIRITGERTRICSSRPFLWAGREL